MNTAFLTPEFWGEIADGIISWLISTAPAIIIILIATFFILKILKSLLQKSRELWFDRLKKNDELENVNEIEKRADTLLRVLHSGLRIVIWTIVSMMILKKLDLDIGPLLAGAGIAGVAIGFGAQELVRDFISGFFILLENQIRTGDVAIINGTGGLVEAIGLRTITLRDLSGVVHVFQNGKISTLANMTKEWSAMIFDIGVAYKEDVDNVIRVMEETAKQMRSDEKYKQSIIEDLEIMGLDKFADSAVIVKARFKTKPIKQWEVGREYRKRLKKAFDDNNIEIPFPHQTIYWGAEIDPLRIKNSVGKE